VSILPPIIWRQQMGWSYCAGAIYCAASLTQFK